MSDLKITGRMTNKRYKCSRCGHESMRTTNHYGSIYPECRVCNLVTVHKCLDPVPEGWGIPEEWKIVKLGDIAEII
jgi:DNA-directed RNA polymerase subunit RPC12/RpoP